MSFGIPVRNGLGVGLLASTSLSTRNGGPALALNFLLGTLDPRITFTRGSTATFVGSNGLIQSAATNTPRFDYDPVTLAPKGLLIEEQRTNLVTYSDQFDNAAWSKTRSSVTANVTTSPDGTVNADKLVEDTTASATHGTQQVFTGTVALYTYTIYAKASERSQILLRLYNGTAFVNETYFDISTGVVISGTGGTITSTGNGWYRCSITGTLAAASCQAQVYLAVGGVFAYTGDGTSGIFIWGAQLEAGSFATSYIPTVASQVTRSADVATMTGTNFSSWYNQTQGTWVLGYQTAFTGAAPASAFMIALDSASAKRHMYISNGAQIASNFDGTNILSAAQNSTGIVAKSASAYSATEKVIVSLGGGVATGPVAAGYSTGTSVLLPSGGNNFSGWVRALAYYNTRLPNATLQVLTA